jgi:hypothetical protein
MSAKQKIMSLTLEKALKNIRVAIAEYRCTENERSALNESFNIVVDACNKKSEFNFVPEEPKQQSSSEKTNENYFKDKSAKGKREI